MHSWIALIPLFPLVGATINGLAGAGLQRKLGKRAVQTIAIAALVLSCLVCELAFAHLLSLPPAQRSLRASLGTLWQTGDLRADFTLLLDPLSMLMALVITHVSCLIHIYSVGYMAQEPAQWRYFAWLNLFVAAMLLLVMGANLALLFIGWEGVGLCSWGLIGFWHEDPSKAAAAGKAFLVNRIGDFGLLLAIALAFSLFQTLDFASVRLAAAHASPQLITAICLLLLLGAAGKSAQLPLYVWLPDAMAGPTPVSALIHAATMVAAGVYLIARLDVLFLMSPVALSIIASVGALTALFAASIALVQTDIKKVLAYSTVSQLGLMFVGLGSGAIESGLFHLFTHALFKACLFLAAGSVILACHHEQEMRNMGGLAARTPYTRWAYLAGCCAIAGFPFASGFYSKDELLFRIWTSENLALSWLGRAIYCVGALAALGTAFYMFRSYYMAFSGTYRGAGAVHHRHADDEFAKAGDLGASAPRESPRSMTAVLTLLALASIFAALPGLPESWTGERSVFARFLAPALDHTLARFRETSRGEEIFFQLIGVAIATAGWLAARALYRDDASPVPARIKAALPRLFAAVQQGYRVDALYRATVVRLAFFLSHAFDHLDRNLIDRLVSAAAWLARAVAAVDDAIDRLFVDGAVHGLAAVTWRAGGAVRSIQTGRIQTYLACALGGALALVLLQYAIH